jgi:hypothetical protein
MHKITLRLTREELDYVMLRAKRELSDPATWIRRTAVSIADGRAKVSRGSPRICDVAAPMTLDKGNAACYRKVAERHCRDSNASRHVDR